MLDGAAYLIYKEGMFISQVRLYQDTLQNTNQRFGQNPHEAEKNVPVNGKPASKRDLKEVSHLLSEQMDHLLTLSKDNSEHYKEMVKQLTLINKRQMDLGYAAGYEAWIKRLWSTLAVSGPAGIFIGLTIKAVEYLLGGEHHK